MSKSHFDPACFLKGESTSPYALIILNQPFEDFLFEKAWNFSEIKVCADGGANRVYDHFKSDEERKQFIPHIITGDFDSLREDVKVFYENLGTKLIHNPDQYSTDFMKAVNSIKSYGTSYSILALGGMGGRVDQQFHSIHHLFLSKKEGQLVYLISSESITFLLDEGVNDIVTPRELVGETCGIIPVTGLSTITTSGLRYNITDWETSFGTQVSTSNELISDSVVVECDKPVLFTVEIRNV